MKRRIRNLVNAVLNELVYGGAATTGKQLPETGTSLIGAKEGSTIKLSLTLRGEDRPDENT